MPDLGQRLKSLDCWRSLLQFGARAWSRVQRISACRECGERISPLAPVCHRCGAGNPFKVAISPQLLLTAVTCEMVLLWLRLRCG